MHGTSAISGRRLEHNERPPSRPLPHGVLPDAAVGEPAREVRALLGGHGHIDQRAHAVGGEQGGPGQAARPQPQDGRGRGDYARVGLVHADEAPSIPRARSQGCRGSIWRAEPKSEMLRVCFSLI